MLHAPRQALRGYHRDLLPGAESSHGLMPLEGDPDSRVAVHAVCREAVFWEHLEDLREAGASCGAGVADREDAGMNDGYSTDLN